ncbi:monocarboxylate transporter 9 [Eurytemora carolleeae]|uniref:monocarboxylate transporter 9 n=1 Tax=Eurytemora carolleeae TaxID=1294199 RepID=UPI000C76C015|nr:monocarboxylate transporter 9 [Eurytemora carolleeae]|eukprot:XP_023331483.1 monocarboxylate transporter 9-like [Eurytemora affinis]
MRDNCKKCKIKRYDSSRSCQSSSVATAVTSLSVSKGPDEPDDQVDQLDGLKFLAERDMRSLHRHIPALGRKDVQFSAIRQHFYPEGGWGWVVVFCSFLAHCLTSGNLLAGGAIALQLQNNFKTGYMTGVWAPLVAWVISLAVAPLVTHICSQYSVRLIAVVAGLVLNMAFLFASFGSQLHQVVLSYGVLLGAASGTVRETCSIMLGQYFKSRRLLVEVFVSCGSGLGVIIFSLLYKESIRFLGWRLGLQSLQGLFLVSFFLGLFYRSASLYHPQRDAISHIKHQKEKVKSKSFNKEKSERKKMRLINLSLILEPNIRIYLASMTLSAGGIYTPVFIMPLHLTGEGEMEHFPLLGVWLGLSMLVGSLGGFINISFGWVYPCYLDL